MQAAQWRWTAVGGHGGHVGVSPGTEIPSVEPAGARSKKTCLSGARQTGGFRGAVPSAAGTACLNTGGTGRVWRWRECWVSTSLKDASTCHLTGAVVWGQACCWAVDTRGGKPWAQSSGHLVRGRRRGRCQPWHLCDPWKSFVVQKLWGSVGEAGEARGTCWWAQTSQCLSGLWPWRGSTQKGLRRRWPARCLGASGLARRLRGISRFPWRRVTGPQSPGSALVL